MINQLSIPTELCEFKFSGGKSVSRFEGYASVFNSSDQIGDRVLPGAFKSTIEDKGPSGVFMRYEHLRHTTPGKWIHMEEDTKGYLVAGELTPGHSLANDIGASFKHETIAGLSIGWIPGNSVIHRKSGGRDLEKVDVFEISITANPMEAGAEITSFKSEIEEVKSLQDAERMLRESANWSKSMATMFTGHLKAMIQSESEASLREEMDELKSRVEIDVRTSRIAEIISRL